MTIQYNWNITQLDRKLNTGIVFRIHYSASAVDEDFSANTTGLISLAQPDESELIPYENLTKSTVLGWVYERVGQETENLLFQIIDDQKNPKEASGLPWVNE